MLIRLRPAAGLMLVLSILFQAPPALRLAAARSGRPAEPTPSPVATGRRATPDDADSAALERARLLLESVRSASYPELKDADIRVRLFRSDRDFFRTRFDGARCLSGQNMLFFD